MISANISKETRKAIYRRDGWRCALCGDTAGLQVHHIIPKGEGGTNSRHNLVALCWRCHAVAHGTHLAEWPYCDTTAMEVNQCIVEYISDYYASQGVVWSPWGLDKPP